jgi:hypothetical protein
MVITSMNLYDFSELNNEEMGVLLTAKDDESVFSEARTKAQSIINSAKKIQLKGSVLDKVAEVLNRPLFSTNSESKKPKDKSSSDSTKPKGFCIRCGNRIPYNEKAPYCSDCFSKWSEGGGNPDYRERNGRCHACGESATPTKEKPLCNSCYRKSQRGR